MGDFLYLNGLLVRAVRRRPLKLRGESRALCGRGTITFLVIVHL